MIESAAISADKVLLDKTANNAAKTEIKFPIFEFNIFHLVLQKIISNTKSEIILPIPIEEQAIGLRCYLENNRASFRRHDVP